MVSVRSLPPTPAQGIHRPQSHSEAERARTPRNTVKYYSGDVTEFDNLGYNAIVQLHLFLAPTTASTSVSTMMWDWIYLIPPFLIAYGYSVTFPRWKGYGQDELKRLVMSARIDPLGALFVSDHIHRSPQ